MKSCLLIPAAFVLLLGRPLSAAGQDAAPRPERAVPAACFQPDRLPACRSFWITEFGLIRFVTPPPGYEDYRRTLLRWDVGRMWNLRRNDAAGWNVFLAMNDNQFRLGLGGRYRGWGPAGMVLEFGSGIIALHSDEDLAVRPTLGLAANGTVSVDDRVGATAQLEYAPGGVGALVGATLGATLGAVVGLAVPVLGLVFLRDD